MVLAVNNFEKKNVFGPSILSCTSYKILKNILTTLYDAV